MQIINIYPKNRRVYEHTQHACLEASVTVRTSFDLNPEQE